MWLKVATGDYVNMQTASSTQTVELGTDWRLRVNGSAVLQLDLGPYPTQADAQAAAQALVVGVDPSTLV